MMKKIKRTKKRIAASGAHIFFHENRKLWNDLRVGDIVEVPADQYDSIKAVYGDSIELVTSVPARSTKSSSTAAKPTATPTEENK